MPASSKLMNVGAVGIAAESTVGTAETITAASAHIEDGKWSIEHDLKERNAVRDVAAPLVPLVGAGKYMFSGKHELRGSGTAGTEPTSLAALLKASGFAVTTVASLYNRYALLDNPSSGAGAVSIKTWVDGIFAHGRGIRGNGVLELKAGDFCYLNFDGQGSLYAEGESATPSEPDDSVGHLKLENGGCQLLEVNQTTRFVKTDGTAYELADGAASNVKFAVKITGSGKKLSCVAVKAKKNGTPANETNGLTAQVEGDDSGPDGVAITNGTATAIATTQVGTTSEWIFFWFATPPTLVDSTVYWFVWTADYDADPDNNIEFATEDVSATEADELSMFYDAAWAAVDEETFSIIVGEADEPDLFIGDIEIDPGAKVSLRKNAGSDEGIFSAAITGFEPTLKITPLETTDAERDFYAYLTGATELLFYCALGTTAGDKFRVYVLSCRRKNNWEPSDIDGDLAHGLELAIEKPSNYYIEAR